MAQVAALQIAARRRCSASPPRRCCARAARSSMCSRSRSPGTASSAGCGWIPRCSRMGEIARPVGGALLVLLGIGLARWRPRLPWAIAAALLIAGLAAPRVYLRVTTPPPPPRAELPPARAGRARTSCWWCSTRSAPETSRATATRRPDLSRARSPGRGRRALPRRDLSLDLVAALPRLALHRPLPVEPRRPRRAPVSRRALSDAGGGARAQGLRDLLHHGQPVDQRRPRAHARLRLAGHFAARAGRRRAAASASSIACWIGWVSRMATRAGRGGRQLRGLDTRAARGRRAPRLRVPELHRGALPLSPAAARVAVPLHRPALRRAAPDQHRSDSAQQFGGKGRPLEEARAPATDMYDGGVVYSNPLLGRVVEALRARGVLDRTVLVVLADHGEMLGERGGYFGHGPTLYQESIGVPLLVRYPPRIPAGVRVAQPVSTLGVFATILDLAGIEAPPTLQVGSLAPLASGESLNGGGPVLSELHVSARARRLPPRPIRRCTTTGATACCAKEASSSIATSKGESLLLRPEQRPAARRAISRPSDRAKCRRCARGSRRWSRRSAFRPWTPRSPRTARPPSSTSPPASDCARSATPTDARRTPRPAGASRRGPEGAGRPKASCPAAARRAFQRC